MRDTDTNKLGIMPPRRGPITMRDTDIPDHDSQLGSLDHSEDSCVDVGLEED